MQSLRYNHFTHDVHCVLIASFFPNPVLSHGAPGQLRMEDAFLLFVPLDLQLSVDDKIVACLFECVINLTVEAPRSSHAASLRPTQFNQAHANSESGHVTDIYIHFSRTKDRRLTRYKHKIPRLVHFKHMILQK